MSNEKQEEGEEETVMTLKEYFAEQSEMEEEVAEVVLGGLVEEGKCSYTHGYMKRQAVYSCLTCFESSQMQAGVCHACYVNCHDGHDIVELYTKRHFRCDCGNSKFAGFKCSLFKAKDAINSENQYNDNFSGLYCICKRPYPDDECQDEMSSCNICEDWFHVSHLTDWKEDLQELTCSSCLAKHEFLRIYRDYLLNFPEQIDVVDDASTTTNTEATSAKRPRFSSELSTTCRLTQFRDKLATLTTNQTASLPLDDRSNLDQEAQIAPLTVTNGMKADTASAVESSVSSNFNEPGVSQQNSERPIVLYDKPKEKVTEVTTTATVAGALSTHAEKTAYWPENWRQEVLCDCESCKQLYAKEEVSFLLDPEDPVHIYAQKGRDKLADLESKVRTEISQSFNNMPRPAAIHFASKIVKLREDMETFFADQAKDGPITAAAVNTFFSEYKRKSGMD